MSGTLGPGAFDEISIKNTLGNTINPATEDRQDDILVELEKKADATETQPVSASSLPLPTGASTSALQTTGNTLLGGIAGMIPSVYDYISQTVGATSKTFVFKNGGVSGTTVATIVIQYTDSSLEVMQSVTKT